MLALDVLYTALATIGIIVIIQIITFVGARLLVPPEPRIIYREIQVPVQQQVQQIQTPKIYTEPAILQQEIKLPEYEPRQQASDSLRLDPQLPLGIQETRPPGT
jgi:hypothetical protein